jgi:hypothetical protein
MTALVKWICRSGGVAPAAMVDRRVSRMSVGCHDRACSWFVVPGAGSSGWAWRVARWFGRLAAGASCERRRDAQRVVAPSLGARIRRPSRFARLIDAPSRPIVPCPGLLLIVRHPWPMDGWPVGPGLGPGIGHGMGHGRMVGDFFAFPSLIPSRE